MFIGLETYLSPNQFIKLLLTQYQQLQNSAKLPITQIPKITKAAKINTIMNIRMVAIIGWSSFCLGVACLGMACLMVACRGFD